MAKDVERKWGVLLEDSIYSICVKNLVENHETPE
jgi:hypothetical protein